MPVLSSSTRAASLVGPARGLRAVTPSDDADLPDGITRALFVGAAGDVAVVDAGGVACVLASGASQYHPIAIRRVRATGTTAAGVVALY